MVPQTDISSVQITPNPYKYELDRLEYTEGQLDPAINSTVSMGHETNCSYLCLSGASWH